MTALNAKFTSEEKIWNLNHIKDYRSGKKTNAFDIKPASNSSESRKRKDPRNCSKLLSFFEEKSFQQHFQPDRTIFLHGDPVEDCHLVVSGIVRCCTINSEGGRQIFRFAKKGEFVGISDIDTRHFTAEAVDHVVLKSIPHSIVEQALAVDPALRHEFRTQICSQLENREKQLLSMVSTKAAERLFNFLCEYASSRPGTGYIALPMCRRDIADHLGLSVETISRSFSELKRTGRIDLATSGKFKICAETRINTVTEHVPHLAWYRASNSV